MKKRQLEEITQNETRKQENRSGFFKSTIVRAGLVLAGIAYITGCSTANYQNKPVVKFGPNAIESHVSYDKDANFKGTNVRAWNSASIQYGSVNAGYRGMNKVSNVGDTNDYGGRNVGTIGADGIDPKATIVVKTNNDGVKDVKYGVSSTALPKLAGLKGFVDLTFNDKAANLTTRLFTPITEGFQGILTTGVEMPYDGKASIGTEIEGKYWVTKNLYVDVAGKIKGVDNFKTITFEGATAGIGFSF